MARRSRNQRQRQLYKKHEHGVSCDPLDKTDAHHFPPRDRTRLNVRRVGTR